MEPNSSNAEESLSAALAPEAAEMPSPLLEPSADSPASTPSTHEEPAPMIDVHPPHQPVHTWKDFLIHMSAICLGLLIAIGLEQSVEYFHHRHQAREARASIQQELRDNVTVVQKNLDNFAEGEAELAKDMDVLNSQTPDAQTLPVLQYSWHLLRQRDAAWNAAKTDGSIALIAPQEIADANYFYASSSEPLPVLFAYITDMDAAGTIVEHARIAGKLDQAEREQLRILTASSIGRGKFLSGVAKNQLRVLNDSKLDH